jgi:hypothetical protein
MPCYGYTNEQQCQFLPDNQGTDFCPCHERMYFMSIALKKPDDFFNEPKMYKLEYRYKLRYITSYRYFSQMYHMEKFIEKKLERFKHFFETTLIQRCFKRAISNPSYNMCRSRLLREFNDSDEYRHSQ